jgi:hypothetical protein
MIPQLFTFDIYKVRRPLSTPHQCCSYPAAESNDAKRSSSDSDAKEQRRSKNSNKEQEESRLVVLEKFGHKVHWIPGLHYTEQELEPQRLIGDEELDHILDLEFESSDHHHHHGVVDSSNHGARDDCLAEGRFTNILQECATVYHRHKEEEIKRRQRHQQQHQQQEQHQQRQAQDKDSATQTTTTTTTTITTTTADNLPPAPPIHNPKQMAMYKFYHHYHDQIPPWVHWEQIQRGMDVFILYAPVAGQALFYLSLVPGFSIPKIAKVLQQTRYLAPPSTAQQVKNRLMDTGGFLANVVVTVMDDPQQPCRSSSSSSSSSWTLRPGGRGWNMALQVRLLHAKVRRSILKKKRKCHESQQQQHQQQHHYHRGSSSSDHLWDVKEYGVPINQEDMAATLLAFSVNVLMGIEFVAGRPLSMENQRDYLALWRYIGWLLGVRSWERDQGTKDKDDDDDDDDNRNDGIVNVDVDDDLPRLDPCGPKLCSQKNDGNHAYDSILHAHASLESFILHLMHPNQSSIDIAHHLLQMGGDNYSSSPSSSQRQRRCHRPVQSFAFLYRSFMCRRYIGNELADALELVQPSIHGGIKSMAAYGLTWMVLFVLRLYTLLTMKSKWFQKFVYMRHCNLLRKFEQMWSKNHKERMIKSERMAKVVKRNDDDNDDELEVRSLGDDKVDESESFCPFGLVMPPTDVQHHVVVVVEDHVKTD